LWRWFAADLPRTSILAPCRTWGDGRISHTFKASLDSKHQQHHQAGISSGARSTYQDKIVRDVHRERLYTHMSPTKPCSWGGLSRGDCGDPFGLRPMMGPRENRESSNRALPGVRVISKRSIGTSSADSELLYWYMLQIWVTT
jgi:hypothetical protein